MGTVERVERRGHEETRQNESIEGSSKKEERQELVEKVERRAKVSHVMGQILPIHGKDGDAVGNSFVRLRPLFSH